MKNLVFVSVLAVVGLVPSFALPQPSTGGSGFGCDTKGSQSDNAPRSDRSGAHSSLTTRSESPGALPPAATPRTPSAPPSTKPITKPDCERAGGTWEEMQMKCTLC